MDVEFNTKLTENYIKFSQIQIISFANLLYLDNGNSTEDIAKRIWEVVTDLTALHKCFRTNTNSETETEEYPNSANTGPTTWNALNNGFFF